MSTSATIHPYVYISHNASTPKVFDTTSTSNTASAPPPSLHYINTSTPHYALLPHTYPYFHLPNTASTPTSSTLHPHHTSTTLRSNLHLYTSSTLPPPPDHLLILLVSCTPLPQNHLHTSSYHTTSTCSKHDHLNRLSICVQVLQFVGEYSNVLHTLYLMECERGTGLDAQQLQLQRDQFLRLLQNLLTCYGHDTQAKVVFFHGQHLYFFASSFPFLLSTHAPTPFPHPQ